MSVTTGRRHADTVSRKDAAHVLSRDLGPRDVADVAPVEPGEINGSDMTHAQQRKKGALSKPCYEHGAEAGTWCFPSMKAVCGGRWARGAGALIARPQRIEMSETRDGLADLAKAARNAYRHDRWREHDAEARARQEGRA
ncbi:MAG: hypothetical protein ABUL47_05705 [Leifsonia sp.]